MTKLYLFRCLFLLTATLGSVYAQDNLPDNKGKEFWLMFNRNYDNSGVNLDLFITGELPTDGQVILPGNVVIPFSVTPGEITKVDIPSSMLPVAAEGVENKGFQVIADEEVTVYGLNQRANTTDAYLGLPVDILGTEYIVVSYNTLGGNLLASMLGVVATMDNTTITIIPTATSNNKTAGVPFQVTMNRGQSYQFAAITNGVDLTGSIISSNHPIAVFSGHTCANVPVGSAACDHMVEQIPPVSALGQSFVTIPLASRRAGDRFRIVATQDDTEVSISGTGGYSQNFTINRGGFREVDIPSTVFTRIVADKAVLVAQFSKGQTTDNVISDPFMMLIPPFEQFQNSYTVGTPSTGFSRHYVNLAVPISQKGNIQLDGNLLDPSSFTDIPGTEFSGAQVAISAGTHNLEGDLPFGAFVYGFGNFDSYGYPGGQALARVEQVREIRLDLQPEIRLGSTYCFKGIVTDEEGNPVFGARVDFEVQGVNSKIGFGVTNEMGQAEFCFDAINEGVDMVFARIGNIERSTSVTTVSPRPTTIIFIPAQIEAVFGEEVCAQNVLLDQFGEPFANQEIVVALDGVEIARGITEGNGVFDFCFTPNKSGELTLASSFEGSRRFTTIFEVEAPASVASDLKVDPATTTVPFNEEICVTATVLDQFGEAMEGVEVFLEINGQASGSAITDEDGVAEFCKTFEIEEQDGQDGDGLRTLTFYYAGGARVNSVITLTRIPILIIPVPTLIRLAPVDENVIIGEQICFDLEVLDQFDNLMEGVEISFSDDQNLLETADSDAEGKVRFCVTPQTLGGFGYEFNFAGGQPISAFFNVVPIASVATTVVVEPVEVEISTGTETCIEVLLLDQYDMPISGADFFIELDGNLEDEATSGQDGKYQFCLSSNTAGQFNVGFYIEGGVKVFSVINVIDILPIPTIMNISLSEEQIQVGEELCLAVTVLDQFGLPVVGADVTLDVNGVFYGRGITDENGRLDFCITPDEAGVLVFDAKVDVELQGSASALVTEESTSQQPIPTTLNLSVSDKQVEAGEDICLTATVLDQFGLPVVGAGVSLAINGQDSGKGFTWEFGRATFCLGTSESGVIIFDVTVNEDLKGSISVLVTDESSDDIAIKAFALVDADKNQIIREIKEGDVLLYSEIKDLSLNFVAIADPEIVGSVWIEMESRTWCETCPSRKTGRVENVIPYALFGDINSNYNGRKLSSGEYTLYAKPYAGSNRQGKVGLDHTVNFTIKYDVEVNTFVLVDSHTNQDVQEIRDGDVLDLAKLGDLRFNIRGEADQSPIGAMTLEIEGPVNFSIFERVAPYALFGDNKGNYAGRKLPLGKYTLKAKAYPNSFANNPGFGGEMATIQFEVISGIAVTSYTLINADTNEDIMELNDQDILDLNKYGNTRLSIRANTVGDDIQSVVMMLSGPIRTTIRERIKPYALFGDLPVNNYSGKHFRPGNYELTSTPYDRNNLAGGAKTIRFTAKYGENLRVAFADQVLEEKESDSEDALESGKITIYPQPSNGLVNFKYPSGLAENTYLQIIDSHGRIIYGGDIGQTPAFDFRNFGSGLYLLIIHAENEPMKHKIIIH